MQTLAGKTALITGGASGIGKIMTRLLLERDVLVVIWDIDTAAAQGVVEEFSRKGEVAATAVDLSDAAQIEQAARALMAKISIDIIINNAGIVVGKRFSEHTVLDLQRTLDINTLAPMLITRAFLPAMLARNSGHICNIASSAGLVANPKMTAYVASKWAMVGFSDSLRLELAQLGSSVNVTTVMPYYIDTGMFAGVRSRIPILNAEAAAKTIISAIERRRRLVTLPGYIYRLTRIAQGLLPLRVYDWVAGSLLGVYKTMDDFRGRG